MMELISRRGVDLFIECALSESDVVSNFDENVLFLETQRDFEIKPVRSIYSDKYADLGPAVFSGRN
jgi:hypothetical protein